MDASLLEIARARFLAADRAAVVVDIGDETVIVPRESIQFLRSGAAPALPSATPAPWSAVIAVILDLGRRDRVTALRRRVLVGFENVVALQIED